MGSRWISVAAAGEERFDAFVATPPVPGGPGILLIQEIFGINEHIQSVAQQYSADGYVVLAPDLFWRNQRRVTLGYGDADFKKGFELLGKLDRAQAIADLAAAAIALRALPECAGPVASIGYCAGGLFSCLVAASGAVDGAVCYYAGGIGDQLEAAKTITCPILFHFAGNDKYIPRTTVDAVRKAFAHRQTATVHTYPNVDHGFNCWARPAYNQRAATLAHGRTLEFLSGL